jgi:Domain of unknown function (DUF3471)/Domain of unknown function (DUF4440)
MLSFIRLSVALCLSASMVYATDESVLSPAEQKVANIRAGAHSGLTESRSPGTEQELIQVAQARQLAYARGDCRAWAGYVSDDFRFIDQAGHSFTRDQEMRECQLQLPPGSKSERVLTSFHCQIKGNLAFLDYRVDETQRRSDTRYTQSFRHLDTFERQKKWTVSYAMQVQIFDDPAIAQVDPTTYGVFVGRYENTAGVVDLVTRRGDKLFAQEAEEDTPTELFPENSDTFFIPGDPTRITFVRDQAGKVVGMVVHFPDREVQRKKKVK